jgi:hypothetical protein
MIEIQFKQTAIHPNPELNFLPKKAHENDAAFDLFSSEEITLLPWETRAIPTGLQLVDRKKRNHAFHRHWERHRQDQFSTWSPVLTTQTKTHPDRR